MSAAAIAAGILLLAGVSMAGGGEGELIQFSQNDHWLSVFTYYAFAQVPGVLGLTAVGSIGDSSSRVLDGAEAITTFESGGTTYAAVASFSDDGVQIIDLSDPDDPTAAGSIGDSSSRVLDGAEAITTFESGGTTYAAVASFSDDGVQIIDLSDPDDPTAAGSIGDSGSREIRGATSIATFKSGTTTYAAVAAGDDDGVQIIDLSDPDDPTAAGSIGDSDTLKLDGAYGITTFKSGGTTYAAVASFSDDGVQIIDLSDPDDPRAAGSIGDSGSRELDGANGITTFESGGTTYAAVASFADDGVQLIDLSDPDDPRAAGSIGDSGSREIRGATSIAAFKSGTTTYAAVAAGDDDGVQIIDLSDPDDPTAAGSIGDSDTLKLDGAYGITTFKSGGTTYAAVASFSDDGVQIIDLSDPDDPRAAGSIGDSGSRELDGANGITTFESGGTTYAAVASFADDGVQLIDLSDPDDPRAAGSIGDSGSRELDGATGIATFKSGGKTYAAVASFSDDGVQVIRLNISPTVHAGSDQAVDEGEPVTLSGTAVDYEGDALTYLWTHDSDLPISLTDDTALSADFTAPQVTDEDSTVTFTLTVSDGAATTKDTVKVTITNILGVGPTLRVGDAGSIDRSDARGLNAATGIATFESGNATYATVTSFIEGSVLVIDLSDPDNPRVAGGIGDSDTLNLGGARGITTFESGTTTYAAVASSSDHGVQIIDLSDPDDPRAAGSIGDSSSLELRGANGITTFESGGTTYAAVASSSDDGVQIIDLSDPDNPAAAGSIGDSSSLELYLQRPPQDRLILPGSIGGSYSLELRGARGITTFESGGTTYAAVASFDDNGVQIIDLSDPDNPRAAGSIGDSDTLNLGGADGIATFKSGTTTYAAVTSFFDHGVQVIDLSDPDDPTAAGSIGDTPFRNLGGAIDIATFESGNATYAAVASSVDDGVQVIDLSDPYSPAAAGGIGDTPFRNLEGANGIATFKIGGTTYAAVTSYFDDGIQVIKLNTSPAPTRQSTKTPPSRYRGRPSTTTATR